MQSGTDIRSIMQREFQLRKKRNPSYSLRAFARFLGLGVTSLSEAMSGKRMLSRHSRALIVEKLALSPDEQRYFLGGDRPKLSLREDQFALIAEWYHPAILEMTHISGQDGSSGWFSDALGVNQDLIEEALDRLQKLELLRRKEDGTFEAMTPPVATTNTVPSSAVRRHHQQILSLAGQSLDYVPMAAREFCNMTMAINPEALPKAKKILRHAMEEAMELLETGDRTELYSLSLGLFPLKDHESPEQSKQ